MGTRPRPAERLVGSPVVADERVYLRTTAGGEEDILRTPIFGLVSLDRATGGDERPITRTYAGFDLHPIAAGGGGIYTTAVDLISVSGLAVCDADGTVAGRSTATTGTFTSRRSRRRALRRERFEQVRHRDRRALRDRRGDGPVLATLDLAVTAAPVVVDGTVYARSEKALHAIGEPAAGGT